MKKLYVGAAALLLSLGMAACGGNDKEKKPLPPIDENAVLADSTVQAYSALGTNTTHIGETFFGDWANDELSLDGPQVLTANSIAGVREYDNDLADTIVKKRPAAIYTIKNVSMCDKKLAGWKASYGTGANKVEIDGGYSMKFGALSEDAATGAVICEQWIPNAHNCKIISLTPDTYFVSPNFSEEKDEDGYDWMSNPVVTKGAGVYNFTLVKFEKMLDGCLYGVGATLVEAKEEFVPAEFKEWHLTGTINSWGLTAENFSLVNNEITYTFAKDDEFKITKILTDGTGTWDGNLNSNNVTNKEALEGKLDFSAENIKVVTPGEYTIKVVDVEEAKGLEITAK